jgi:uncharacterized membrane protein YuzA (DUF378 family)
MAVTHTHETHSVGTARRGFGALDWIAMVLLIIGGLNWGLVGLANFDLVATIFGEGSGLSRLVYVLVGVAALVSLYTATKMNRFTSRD